ncbi:MAG: alpha/beta hydrolase, partial [bacterium]
MTAASQSVVTLTAGDFRTLVWGSGDRTVLFLHGLSGVAEVWGPTVSYLPAGRRYVALDQRGHGQSPRSVDISYSVNSFVTDTAELIATLRGRVHLVGHSMGARVALVL